MDRVITAAPSVRTTSPLPASTGAVLEHCEARRDELLERGGTVPGDVLEALARLRQVHELDPSWVEPDELRQIEAQLQAAAESAVAPAADGDVADQRGHGALLHAIRPQITELFHDRDGEPYAAVRVHGATQIHAVSSDGFRRWLAHASYRARGRGASGQMLDDLVQTLAAEAQFDGVEHPVFTRVGELDGATYIDLGHDDWHAVKIESGTWSIEAEPPVKFRRPTSAQALPRPVRGGSIDLLWKYVNADDADRPRILAWLLSALMPRGPYPLLAVQGEQGTAKSSAARFLKRLTDPSKAPLRSMPTNEVMLANAASHAHVLAFDNLSSLSVDLSDALCRLSTGGGVARRKLYTDNDELVLDIQCPVLLTSINDVITRPDLADRTYHVRLAYIEPSDRRSERDLDAEFEQDAPKIFGALLDALAGARAGVDTVHLSNPPRLADAARLAVAAEAVLGLPSGSMDQALASNAIDLDLVQLESVPFARALEALSMIRDWDLTAGELLAELDKLGTLDERGDAAWPKSTKRLSQELERIAPVLRRRHIEVSRYQTSGSNSRRVIRIRRTDREADVPA